MVLAPNETVIVVISAQSCALCSSITLGTFLGTKISIFTLSQTAHLFLLEIFIIVIKTVCILHTKAAVCEIEEVVLIVIDINSYFEQFIGRCKSDILLGYPCYCNILESHHHWGLLESSA